MVKLRIDHGALSSYFKGVCISERNRNCEYGLSVCLSETVDRLMEVCTLCEAGCGFLRETSPKVNLSILLDSKKGIEAVATFLESLPYLLSGWFAWQLSSLRFQQLPFLLRHHTAVVTLNNLLSHMGQVGGEFSIIEFQNFK